MGDSEPVYTLDEALASVGFGNYQVRLLAYGGLGMIAEAMEIMIITFVGSPLQSEWNLSPNQKSLISTVIFLGMMVGALSSGHISDNYGRKKSILWGSIITAVVGLLSAFSPNYISFLLLRCITGVGLGCMFIFISWFLEFVPIPNRGVWMIIIQSFWVVGTVSEAALAWIIMPSFGWRWLVALSCGPCFIILVLYGLVPESPRFLCMKGRANEARNILEQAASVNGTTLETGVLVPDHMQDEFAESENHHLLASRMNKTYSYKGSSSSMLILFSPKLIRSNLLLWFLYFGNTFSYYGIVLLTSELSSDQSKCATITSRPQQSQSASLYIDAIVTSLGEVPGIIFGMFMVDRVGRKLSIVIMLVLALMLLMPLWIHQNETLTATLLLGARAFVEGAFFVTSMYAPEVYPTNVRGIAVGAATSIGRIGGMICPFVAVGLVGACQQTYAVILFQVVILVSALSALLSPFETKGKKLADVVE